MKTLGDCLDAGDNAAGNSKFKEFEDKTFREYLESKKLTPNLIHYILYAIAMCDDRTSCAVGVKRTKQFLQSLGRYGNTPFLFPMYGCGEIPQCFCRLCAVFGGVYCLKRSIEAINIDHGRNEFQSIICGGQTITAKTLVLGNGGRIGGEATRNVRFTATDNDEKKTEKPNRCGQLARAIYIVSKPLGDASLNSGGGGVNVLRLPSTGSANDGAFVIQLAHYSGTCPKDLCKYRSTSPIPITLFHLTSLHLHRTDLIHVTCQASGTSPAQDIYHFERQLFNDTNEDTILWSMYFNIPRCMKCQHSTAKPSANVHIACSPFFELDYDESIRQAKSMFTEIYPDDEFLPRAPDPEEIIIEGDAAPTTFTDDATTMMDLSAAVDGVVYDSSDASQVGGAESSSGDGDTACTDAGHTDTGDTCGTDSFGDTSCSDTGGGSCD